MAPSPGSITRLLVDWRDGDKAALDRLIPLVHKELAGWRGLDLGAFQQAVG